MHIAGSRFDKCAHAALGQRWFCENDTARTTFYVCALASYSHTATCIATTLLHRGCRCCCVSSWLAVPITAISAETVILSPSYHRRRRRILARDIIAAATAMRCVSVCRAYLWGGCSRQGQGQGQRKRQSQSQSQSRSHRRSQSQS